VRWAEVRGRFEPDTAGKAVRSYGVLIDITEHKQAEEVLKIKESAIASSLSAIAMADQRGHLTYVNPAFLKLWGYENEGEVLGKSVLDFWKEPQQALGVMRAIQNGQGWVGELVAVRKDGACRSLYLSASAVRNETDTPICMMGSFTDITERKQAEEALRELNATLESKVAERTAELEHRAKQLQRLTLELAPAHRVDPA
jgi:PAS domain S-box-containing protein